MHFPTTSTTWEVFIHMYLLIGFQLKSGEADFPFQKLDYASPMEAVLILAENAAALRQQFHDWRKSIGAWMPSANRSPATARQK